MRSDRRQYQTSDLPSVFVWQTLVNMNGSLGELKAHISHLHHSIDDLKSEVAELKKALATKADKATTANLNANITSLKKQQ